MHCFAVKLVEGLPKRKVKQIHFFLPLLERSQKVRHKAAKKQGKTRQSKEMKDKAEESTGTLPGKMSRHQTKKV